MEAGSQGNMRDEMRSDQIRYRDLYSVRRIEGGVKRSRYRSPRMK